MPGRAYVNRWLSGRAGVRGGPVREELTASGVGRASRPSVRRPIYQIPLRNRSGLIRVTRPPAGRRQKTPHCRRRIVPALLCFVRRAGPFVSPLGRGRGARPWSWGRIRFGELAVLTGGTALLSVSGQQQVTSSAARGVPSRPRQARSGNRPCRTRAGRRTRHLPG